MKAYRQTEAYKKKMRELEDEADAAALQRRAARRVPPRAKVEETPPPPPRAAFKEQNEYLDRSVKESITRTEFENMLREFPGLKLNAHNDAKIDQWLATNVGGHVSVAGVKAAILNLRESLEWNMPPPPPPQPKPKPTFVGAILPSGERQLPLDATPKQMYAASKAQLTDLARRQVAAQRR